MEGKEEWRNTGEQEKGRGKDKQRQEVKSCNTRAYNLQSKAGNDKPKTKTMTSRMFSCNLTDDISYSSSYTVADSGCFVRFFGTPSSGSLTVKAEPQLNSPRSIRLSTLCLPQVAKSGPEIAVAIQCDM